MIYELKENYTISLLCEILKVSKSGFFNWQKHRGNVNKEKKKLLQIYKNYNKSINLEWAQKE